MTRDRPTAGGQDTTLDGEFPSQLGGQSSRRRPVEVAETVGEPDDMVVYDNRPFGGSSYGLYAARVTSTSLLSATSLSQQVSGASGSGFPGFSYISASVVSPTSQIGNAVLVAKFNVTKNQYLDTYYGVNDLGAVMKSTEFFTSIYDAAILGTNDSFTVATTGFRPFSIPAGSKQYGAGVIPAYGAGITGSVFVADANNTTPTPAGVSFASTSLSLRMSRYSIDSNYQYTTNLYTA